MDSKTPHLPGPLAGPAYLLRGLKMLMQPGLRHFVWMPLLINFALFSVGLWLGIHYFSAALNWLIPAWLEWLRWLLWPLFALLLTVGVFFSFTLVANVIAAPFYGPLADKVLSNLGLELPRPEARGAVAGIAADLASEVRRMGYFASRASPLLLLSAIPGVNLIVPVIGLVFGAWSLALEYLSYPLGAQGMGFQQQRQLLGQHRLETIGFGAAVLFGLSVPLLNVLIPPAAVVGAALYSAERRRPPGPKA